MTMDQFRAIIAADDNVKLLDQAFAPGNDATAAVAALAKTVASDQPYLLDVYARNLAWAGRKQEAIALTDTCIARFGRQSRDALVFLEALQLPLDEKATEVGFAHLGAHPDQVFVTPLSAGVASAVRRAGVQDRYLALIQPWMYDNNFSFDINTAWVLLDTIDGAQKAAELMHRLIGQNAINDRYKAHCLAVETLAARLCRRADLEPDAGELRAQIGKPHDLDTGDAIMGFLAGDLDRAAALARAQPVGKNADEIYYYLALDDLIHGDQAQAKADLATLQAHPTWEENGEARCMLAHFGSPLLSGKAAPPTVTRTPVPTPGAGATPTHANDF
jgi:hypothetical protein